MYGGFMETRIALWKQGLNAEQIQHEYPHLKLEQIYAALAYYHANKEEIEALSAKDLADYDKYRQLFSQKQTEEM
jgi:hypothetical protein